MARSDENPVINTGASCPVCRGTDTEEYRDCLARAASWLCGTCNTVFAGSTEEYEQNRWQRRKYEEYRSALRRLRSPKKAA